MNYLAARFAIILSTFTLISFNLLASNPCKIEGSVVDAQTIKPIPFANVELLKSSDSSLVKATSTNTDGKYLIEDVAYGKYLIRISCIGYRKEVLPEFELSNKKPAIKFGTTDLFVESTSLNEVVVSGQKLTGILEDNKTIYTVKSKSAEFAHSGLELLRLLPDVTVDYISDNVKMAGSSNILFQVNGRKVDRNYLLQLNPELVDKIEVITNPGAKFDSDVEAVINIILKRDMQHGLSGRLRLQIPTSSTVLSKNNASVDFFIKKMRFYVAGNCNIQDYHTQIANKRNTFSPDSSLLSQNTIGTNKGSKLGLTYGVDWFINNNNTLNFYSSIRPQIPMSEDFITDNLYTSNQINSHNQSTSLNVNKNYFYDYSLYFQHQFARKFHEISFESYLSNKNNLNTNDYYEQEYLPEGILSNQISNSLNQITENGSNQLLLKVDYIYPFSEKIKLSTGYNGNFLRSDFLYNDVTDEYIDLLIYDENRHSAYSNLSWTIAKFNFQAGLRYENSNIYLNHESDTINQYNSLLPSLSILYKQGKVHTFSLNYRKSIIRPTVNQLSPINYKNDSYQQSSGNINLKPANINRIELTHRIQIKESMYLSYKPYISFIKNDIRLVNISASDTLLQKKYHNVGNDFEYGVTVSGTLAIGKRWTINPSWTFYRRELEALPEYGISSSIRTSNRLTISSQYILPKDWILFIEYNYNGSDIDYQTTTHPYYDFVAGFNKAVNKKFNVSVFTVNPWSKLYIYNNITTNMDNMVQDTKEGLTYKYLVFVRLGFKFNSGKIGKKLERQVESEQELKTKKGILN